MALDRTIPPQQFNRANVADINANNSDRRKRKQDSAAGGNGGDGSGGPKFNRAPLTFPDPSTFNLVHELTENRDKYRASSRDDGVWIRISSMPVQIHHSIRQIIAASIKPPSLQVVYSACIDNGVRWLESQPEIQRLVQLRHMWETNEEGKLLDGYVIETIVGALKTPIIPGDGGGSQTILLPFYIQQALSRLNDGLGYSMQGLAKIACMVTLRSQTGDIAEDFVESMDTTVKRFIYSMGLRARIGKVILEEFGVTEDE